jgi:hypothetical protein
MDKDIIIQKIEELIHKVDTLADTEKRQTNSHNEWIDKQETMEILKCSERTLQTLRDKELLRFSNPLGGSKLFYRRKDVEALFEKNFNGQT